MSVLFIYSVIFDCDGLHFGMQNFQLWHVHVGSCSPTRDGTQAPCIGSMESQPLDYQGSPGHIEFICGSAPISSLQWHTDLLLGHFFSLPFYTLRGMLYQIILLPQKDVHGIILHVIPGLARGNAKPKFSQWMLSLVTVILRVWCEDSVKNYSSSLIQGEIA